MQIISIVTYDTITGGYSERIYTKEEEQKIIKKTIQKINKM